MKTKFVVLAFFLAGIIIVSGCSEGHNSRELDILHNCSGNVCSIELGIVDKTVSTDLLGKEHVLNKTVIKSVDSNLVWSGISDFATNDLLNHFGLSGRCAGDQCNANDNPTGGVFTAGQSVNVSVTGSVTVDGVVYDVSNFSTGSGWIVEEPTVDSVTFEIPDGWDDGAGGSIGTSGILYSVSGVNVTFTCPLEYPNIVTGVTSTNPQNGLVNVGGSSQDIAVANLKKINTPTMGEIEFDKTSQSYQNKWVGNNGQVRTRVVCVPASSDWVIQ